MDGVQASSRPTLRSLRYLYFLLLFIVPTGAKGYFPSSYLLRGRSDHKQREGPFGPFPPPAGKIRTAPPAFLSSSAASDTQEGEMDSTKSSPSTASYAWTRSTLDLAIPALIASIADPLLTMMDTAYVGRLGAHSLGALGACTSIFYMSFYGFLATKTATTSLVASATTEREAGLVTSTSLQMGIAAGFLVMIGLRLFGASCINAMGISSSSEMFPLALTYLNTRCLSAPFFLLITVAEGALRGYGDTRIPLLASCATAAVMVMLDPLLMFTFDWKLRGSAAAMGCSQVGGALVYAWFLRCRSRAAKAATSTNAGDGSPSVEKGQTEPTSSSSTLTKSKIIWSIVKANFSMIIKQGSLLFTWAYATKCATKLGAAHVAAHQVALSFWMVFAYVLDAVSVGAQVLLSRATASRSSRVEMRSVTKYMLKVAIGQGLLITLLIAGLSPYVPSFFTKDEGVLVHLNSLMPVLSMQQVLISLTFVMEALAAGGSQFHLLGLGTALSALVAVHLMRSAGSILEIWTGGVAAMFVGRLLAASLGVLNVNGWILPWLKMDKKGEGKDKKE